MGHAIRTFYSALINLLGRCAPEMHLLTNHYEQNWRFGTRGLRLGGASFLQEAVLGVVQRSVQEVSVPEKLEFVVNKCRTHP
ncbi:uncharacterized protein ACWYII_007141 isoform 4-T9 [Salvelinus alpinus]|uniref:uncharacterized protein isoform X2 n=1 Tax=Salvelinus alpinus TaxID=8036 RepID=UPI0039FC19EA